MVAHLKELVRAEVGPDTLMFDSIWCMSHRVNLVVRGFEEVDYIKDVLEFADWFSTRRKAVAYRKWLCQSFPTRRFNKIPKPSETRWCFYRGVIAAILSQIDQVNEFIKNDPDFHDFRRDVSLFSTETRTSSSYTILANPFIITHFRFA